MRAGEEYTAEKIIVLEGLEAVRKRPGMYIGSTGTTGLHHLVWEIVDNAIDEALAGYCDTITVEINKDGSLSVTDNGRGMPVDIVEKTQLSAVETIFTVLHAGGKFGEGAYKVAGGLHGVGAAVVNALSKKLEVNVYKSGKEYYLAFENGGHTIGKLVEIGPTDKKGTKVTFMPDEAVFTETTTFEFKVVANRLKQMAFLNRAIRIVVSDLRGEEVKKEEFYYEGGISEYVRHINKTKSAPLVDEVIFIEGKGDFQQHDKTVPVIVEAAIQYTNDYRETIFTFANNIQTIDGGTHEQGFRLAMNRVFNRYARENKIFKNEDERFIYEDIIEGMTAIISIKHPSPEFEGQTKSKLGNPEVRSIVSQVVGEKLEMYLMENPNEARIIMEKIQLSSRARRAANLARESIRRKDGIEFTTLPGKLADCSSRNPEESELFIVEGNSAGGSAKNGRNRHTQAILPLRGKILNVQKAQERRIYENAEVGNMIQAIGAGIAEEFDITKARYHKIIIMTDADVDGSHIRVLLLTFFNRFMRELIKHGYVYIAQPPLYKVDYRGKQYYCYNDEQLEQLKVDLDLRDGYPFQRYKGLGEMDAQQLWDTTMDPEQRKLYRVTISDAIEADTIFEELMGEAVDPRRDFINENAMFVKNLDV
ncbi:MAG TPA: DNA topoisomerase (ATP-hydrolyzing) subunit B [Bacilli bacterium]|nr:DNA topoisomerase (ATP-hydrolyzing) subunit B [Bacilli bacterium]